ncbi:MAG TPA: sigma 54-interacting transcriptional regulator, partial [Oligoflexus sp.]|uniref:sigma 54-interacting transcriptional regulator n=1 Tax=Oligoflexus sp. TaxID=1971216 RepID=UPI002D476489
MKNLNTLQSRHVPIFKGNVSLVRNHQEAMSSFLNKFPEGIVLNPQLRKQIAMAIQEADLPISIEGETGTGKEQIVKYIHAQIHAQQPGPLVIINCANLKKDLASATLFGHKKGAFT